MFYGFKLNYYFRNNRIIFRFFKLLVIIYLVVLSYRSVGVQIRERNAQYVIPGLSKEDAELITKQRKTQNKNLEVKEKKISSSKTTSNVDKKGKILYDCFIFFFNMKFLFL